MNETSAGFLFVLAFFAWNATPQAWWSRGRFGLESMQSMRWPPVEEPPDLKEGYELDAGATKFICVADSVMLMVLAQQVWFPIALWAFGVIVVIAIIRTLWSLHSIHADGGFGRSRNPMELMLLWAPLGAIAVLDLVVVLSAPIHVGALIA